MGICKKYFGLIDLFLSNRYEIDLLNGRFLKWSQIKASVLKGSVLELSLFSNDLPDGSTSNAKLFGGDTSIFSVV